MAGDTIYSYGYTADYYGYGPSWMMGLGGYWYPMSLISPQIGIVELNDSTGYFRYTYGYKDFEYGSIYYTFYHHGEATLK